MAKHEVKYMSEINNFIKGFEKHCRQQRLKAASVIRKEIKRKANAIKKTGNLAAGVYAYNGKDASHVGIHAPAYHAYLIEFGHIGRDGKIVPAHPIVYPTYQEKSGEVEKILSENFV